MNACSRLVLCAASIGIVCAALNSAPIDASSPSDRPDSKTIRVVARVGDYYISSDQIGPPSEAAARKLLALILRPIWDEYAILRGIRVTDADLLAYQHAYQQSEPPNGDEAFSESAAMIRIIHHTNRWEMLKTVRNGDSVSETAVMVRVLHRWKVNEALHGEYGGKVLFPWKPPSMEPVEAYQRLLNEAESRGAFEVYDPEYRERFRALLERDVSLGKHITEEEGLYKPPWAGS